MAHAETAGLIGALFARRAGLAILSLGGWIVLAFLVRAPTFLFAELDLDEHVYALIASDWRAGILPYTQIWDRKPPGLYALLALAQSVLGDGPFTLRALSALAIGTSAYLLSLVARRLLPSLPFAAPLTGLLFIVGGMAPGGGGRAMAAEHLMQPWILLALLAVLALRDSAAPARTAFLAGLAGGAALLVKTVAVFDLTALALLGMVYGQRLYPPRTVAAAALGTALLPAAAAAWFAHAGAWEPFVFANVTTHLTPASADAPAYLQRDWASVRRGLFQFYALIPGAGLALALARPAEWRALFGLGLWAAAAALGAFYLGIVYHHYLLPALAPIALLSGAGLAMVANMPRPRWAWRVAAVAALAAAHVLALDRATLTAVEVTQRRLAGEADFGDRAAAAARLARPWLTPEATLYVFGNSLSLYGFLDRRPPTTLPFIRHLWLDYAPVPGEAEVAAVLATRPTLIVADATFPGVPAHHPRRTRVVGRVRGVLAADYDLVATVEPFRSRSGGVIGGRLPVHIYRLRAALGPS